MNLDTTKAKAYLEENGCTCVLCKEPNQVSSFDRGVKPLLALLDDDNSYVGYSAADKVVGKAAAMIYVKLGVAEVYTKTIGKAACQVLKEAGISVIYDELVEIILRRDKQDICPMEKTVREIDDIDEAIEAVRAKLAEMMG